MTISLQADFNFARAVAAMQLLEEGMSYNERLAFAECKRAGAAEKAAMTMPELFSRDFAFSPILLKSALFRSAERGFRATFTMEDPLMLTSAAGDKITFLGEELRQDDQTVLLTFIKRVAGKSVESSITLTPRKFVRELRWADSGASVEKLKASLRRLRSAYVLIEYAKGGEGTLGFVSDYEIRGGDEWTVWLAPRLVNLFAKQKTFLRVEERQALKEGLQTWAFGFINASVCAEPFPLENMRSWAGSEATQKEFNRALKTALEALVQAEVIVEFKIDRSAVKIVRKMN